MSNRARPCKRCLKPIQWETSQDQGGKWWAYAVNLDGSKHTCRPEGTQADTPLFVEEHRA